MGRQNPQPAGEPSEREAAERLESWKAIAAYLKRDVRTVQRWEKREQLPVHRHVHDKLGTVYAYKAELNAWWNNRQPRLEQGGALQRPERRHWVWLAAVGVIVAVGVTGWKYRAEVKALSGAWDRSEVVDRRVWSGPDVARLGSVSPDGRYLAFSDPETGDLAVRNVGTGQQRRLTRKPPRSRSGEAQAPVFSPDGKRIAFAWNQDFFFELRLIGSDGSGERVVFRDPDVFLVRPADWSSDGRRILATFRRNDGTNQIVEVDAGDGAARVLKTLDAREPSRINYSPDGRYIAYDFPPSSNTWDRDVFLLETSRGPAREIRLVEHPGDDLLLGWAPDGKRVLFASDRSGTQDAWIVAVREGKPSGAAQRVKKDLGRVRPIGFARDGSYYYGLQTGIMDVYIAAMDFAAGRLLASPAPGAQRFVGMNQSPDWSADGRNLAYVPRRLGLEEWQALVVIRTAESNEERELRPQVRTAELLRWHPDGRSLVATGFDLKLRPGLFVIDVETGQTNPLEQSSEPRLYYHDATWSPDGKKIFFKLRDGGIEPSRLLVRDVATGRQKQFLPSVYRYCLSPDGKRFAFSIFDDTSEFLKVMPAGGGEPREIYRQPRGERIVSIAWSQDGRWLLFAKRGQLWRIPADGGEAEKLPLAMPGLREVRVHPDGKRVAFTAGTDSSEVWVMENFLPAG